MWLFGFIAIVIIMLSLNGRSSFFEVWGSLLVFSVSVVLEIMCSYIVFNIFLLLLCL